MVVKGANVGVDVAGVRMVDTGGDVVIEVVVIGMVKIGFVWVVEMVAVVGYSGMAEGSCEVVGEYVT